MDINKIKDGGYTLKEVKEEFKEVDNERINDFIHELKSMINEREQKNSGYFVGCIEDMVGDSVQIYYIRLGFVTEAEAKKRLYDECDEYTIDSGYRKVDHKTYIEYDVYKHLNAMNGYWETIPEDVRKSIMDYMNQLNDKLNIIAYIDEFDVLDDYDDSKCEEE